MEASLAVKFVSQSITLTSQTPSVSLLDYLHSQVRRRIQAHKKRRMASHEKNPLTIITASIKSVDVSSAASQARDYCFYHTTLLSQETRYYSEIIILHAR